MLIHLIAAGRLENPSDWPELWNHCYNIWKSSPYQIKLWDTKNIDDLLKEDDEDFFNILNTLNPIYKWDYVRFVILEKFGGAYFDLDIEIIRDFIYMLNPQKIYMMEGTNGSLVENSIMISSNHINDSVMWSRLKDYSKFQILNNLEDCKINFKVINYAGGNLISNYFSKYLSNFDIKYEILSYPQFASLTNEISFSRHHQTSYWLQN
jgi:mannosyltransferase OCH1-like enzyme